MTAPRPDLAGLPETVPARMVNEFVYCPRLFYLEWVQGRFATSDDVEEGLCVHRVVDEPGGNLPDPDEDVERFGGRTSRSFWVTSTALGVSAKIDIVEVGSDGVTPVDYKKGAPGKNGRAWPADEIQSVLQALLLQEAGYQVPRAEIWYAETRQRVVVPLGIERLDEARTVLTRLWQVAASDDAPPPLVDSPKCPRCSLVGLCLPDELNALRVRDGVPRRPRGVMAADPDSRPVYVMEQGAVVAVRRGRLEVFKERENLASYRLIDVSQVCLLGNVTVTPQVMRELFAREVPVCWFSYGGWFTGMAEGLPSKHVALRRSQYTAPSEMLLSAAGRMIEGKIRNSRTLLRRNSKAAAPDGAVDQLHALATAAARAQGYPTLLGLEGTAARIYFAHFTAMLNSTNGLGVAAFNENGRARRPPPDPVNALLSFVYALLVKDLTITLAAVGFDPFLGVFHRPRYGRPALALDLAEEFRPLIADSTVIQLINNSEIRPAHFTQRAGGCQLDRDGRRAVLNAYERRMSHEIKHPVFGYRVNYRRALDVQARLLAAHLTGEIDEYTPFTTR